jgi:branched-chain amino acid transport system substrate-binding protein
MVGSILILPMGDRNPNPKIGGDMERIKKSVIFWVVGVCCLFSCAAFAAEFPIGAFLPMTGPGAYIGQAMSRGALTAVDQVNESGGVAGYKFKLIITDFKNVDVNLAVSGVRKMISIDKIPAVLAAYSPTTLACQPICEKANVVMLNGGAYSPKLVNKPYLHTIRLAQHQMVPPMLEFLWKRGVRKLAAIYVSDPSGIIPVKDYIGPMWSKMGGTIVADEPHQSGITEFSAYLARIKAGNPDVIVSYTTGESMAYLVKQAREMGMTCPIVLSDWMPDYQTITGKTSENVYNCSEFFDATSPDPITQRFVKGFEAKWKEQTEFFSANYYDAVYHILAELIKRVVSKGGNPLNGAELEQAIWTNPAFKTVYGGQMRLMKDGSVSKPMVILKIVNGKLTVAEKMAVDK